MNLNYRWIATTGFLCAQLSLAGSNSQAQTYVFGNASYPAPGVNSNTPPPIVTADFNHDGIPDVAVLGTSSGGDVLSIFLARPDGSFASRVDYVLQPNAGGFSGFTVGDFNGDSKLDIVVVDYPYLSGASILFGNGDGTFQSPAPLNQNTSNGYTEVASADFNGDGKLDLLVESPEISGAVAILLGNGDGTFQPPVTYTVSSATYLVLRDFNGDGKPDIAVSGGFSGSGEVSILINKGGGTFKSPTTYSIAGNVQALAAADLNSDGKLDLVVPSGGTSGTISVLLGNGDGTFGNPIVYSSDQLSIYSTSVAVADFSGDGKLDLALTNSVGTLSNSVVIVLGNGDGTFQNPPRHYSAGLLPAALVSLDANGDGKPDLTIAGGYGVLFYFSLTTLINNGDGTFPNPPTYPVLPFPYSAVAGDFNGDGRIDIATTSITQTGGVSVLLGKDDGTFQAHVDSPIGQSPTAIAAGDFSGDGKLDLVVADSSPTSQLLSTLIGNGDGTFKNNIAQTSSNIVRSLAVGDFNGDGKFDLAAVIDGTHGVSIFLGHGDGSFAAPVSYPTGSTSISPQNPNALVGDFNGDNKLDVAVATDNGIATLLGNGDGTFQAFSIMPSLLSYDPEDQLLALADFNGDAKLDIVKATQTAIINVALGNGDGTFQQASAIQVPPGILNTESSVVGDFNGDGKLDLAFASQSTNVLTILLGNGDGTFKGHIEYSVPSVSNNVNFMLAADFNGDGALDLALADFDAGAVSVFLNRPVAAFAPRALTFANQGLDTTSSEESVTLTNAGAAPLTITSIGATGDFAETNNCGSSLSIGKACTVNVTFAPTVDGVRSGLLTFTDNASVVPQVLALSGTGTGAGFMVGIAAGSSASQTITAGQTASYSLIVTPEGGFNGTITLACSSSSIAVNCTATPASIPLTGNSAVTATVNVATTAVALTLPVPRSVPAWPVSFGSHFSFGRVGLLLATLFVFPLLVAFACRNRQPRWLALTSATALVLIWAGCGGGGGSTSGPPPPPSATISPASLTFSSENQGSTSPMQNVKLTNSGNTALSIRAISIGGSNSGDFQQTNTCGTSVVAGGNCSIGVTFTPTATGARSATLSIGDNATSSPQSVALAGTGVLPVTPAGTYTITVTTTSGALIQTTHLMLTVQ